MLFFYKLHAAALSLNHCWINNGNKTFLFLIFSLIQVFLVLANFFLCLSEKVIVFFHLSTKIKERKKERVAFGDYTRILDVYCLWPSTLLCYIYFPYPQNKLPIFAITCLCLSRSMACHGLCLPCWYFFLRYVYRVETQKYWGLNFQILYHLVCNSFCLWFYRYSPSAKRYQSIFSSCCALSKASPCCWH